MSNYQNIADEQPVIKQWNDCYTNLVCTHYSTLSNICNDNKMKLINHDNKTKSNSRLHIIC